MTSNSLNGTTWVFNLGGGGSETVTFNANGTASFGGAKVWYWGEDVKSGHFEVQSLNPMLQNNISEIYFGSHSGGTGSGFYINGILPESSKAVLSPFTMSKKS